LIPTTLIEFAFAFSSLDSRVPAFPRKRGKTLFPPLGFVFLPFPIQNHRPSAAAFYYKEPFGKLKKTRFSGFPFFRLKHPRLKVFEA
jgi:hypothetical protein